MAVGDRDGVTARVRIALIGAGSMGAHHARIIADSEHAELAVVVDADAARAEALAFSHGAAAAPDIGIDVLRTCDAAVIATTTESHPAVATALLGLGLPLLVEKPLADEFGHVEHMVARAAAAGVPLMCGFVERFNPVVRTALEILEGPPVHVVALRHSPPAPQAKTSVLWDLLIHDLDMATLLAGGSPVAAASGVSLVPAGFAEAELFDATVRFDSGFIATMSASRLGHRKVRQMSIQTANMLVELDLVRQDITVWRHLADEMVRSRAGTYRASTVFEIPFVRSPAEPLAAQFTHFLGLIDGTVDAGTERASLLPPHRVAGALRDHEKSRLSELVPAGSSAPMTDR